MSHGTCTQCGGKTVISRCPTGACAKCRAKERLPKPERTGDEFGLGRGAWVPNGRGWLVWEAAS